MFLASVPANPAFRCVRDHPDFRSWLAEVGLSPGGSETGTASEEPRSPEASLIRS